MLICTSRFGSQVCACRLNVICCDLLARVHQSEKPCVTGCEVPLRAEHSKNPTFSPSLSLSTQDMIRWESHRCGQYSFVLPPFLLLPPHGGLTTNDFPQQVPPQSALFLEKQSKAKNKNSMIIKKQKHQHTCAFPSPPYRILFRKFFRLINHL